MVAITQPRAFGAATGSRYSTFDHGPVPDREVGRLTQPRAFGAFTGRRYGSFAGKTGTLPRDISRITQAYAFGAGVGRRYGSFLRTEDIFNVVVGNTLNTTGDVGLAASSTAYQTGFEFEAPVQLTTVAGVVGFSVDIQVSTAFDVQVGIGVRPTGTTTLNTVIGVPVNFPATLALAGAVSASADVAYDSGPSFDIDPVGPSVSGAVSLSSDVEIYTEFDIDPVGPSLFGAVGTAADIELGTLYNLVPSDLGVVGSFTFVTNILAERPFNFDTSAVSLAGGVTVRGNIYASEAVFGDGDVVMYVPADSTLMLVPPDRNTVYVR